LRSSRKLWLLITSALLIVSGAAYGSGFSLFEQGAKATAMGGAFAATADDPTAIFYNVAGIAQQRKAAFTVGGTAINFSNEFRGDPNDPTTSGTTGKYRAHTFIPPNAYFILPVGSNITFGVGVMTPYGLRTNWQEPWVGRFISRDANVKVLSVEPAVAWQTSNGKLAIGVGAEYRRSHIALNRNNAAFNPFNGQISDTANAFLNSDWDSAWGWNAGLLFKPSDSFRIGLAYRPGMTIDYNGSAHFTQIPTNTPLDVLVAAQLPPDQSIATSINFPAVLSGGIATSAIGHGWDLEADVTHTTWSRFKSLDVTFGTTTALNFTRPQNWHDTYSYRLGANKKASENWDVRLGAVYDENPQPTEGVGPLLPDSDRIGVSFGVGYHHGPWIVDLTEFVLHFKTRSTNGLSSDNFNGTYKTDANLISINFGYRF
jgi:long-chain fatty acid transport protein